MNGNLSNLTSINRNFEIYIKIFDVIIITVFPFLSLIGFFMNIPCIYIFATTKLTNKNSNNIYKYLTVNSVIDALFLLCFVLVPFAQCTSYCSWTNAYWIKAYKMYVAVYVCRVLDTISSLISISVVVDRYLFVRQLTPVRRTKGAFIVIMACFVVYSTLLYVPNLFVKNISAKTSHKAVGNGSAAIVLSTVKSQDYSYTSSKIVQNPLFQRTMFTVQFISTGIQLLIVIVFSSLLIYKVRMKLKSRNEIDKYSVAQSKKLIELNKSLYNSQSCTQLSIANTRPPTDHSSTENETGNLTPSTPPPPQALQQRQSPKKPNELIHVTLKKSTNLEISTSLMVIWLSVLFVFNQIGISVIYTAFVLLNPNTILYKIIILFYYTSAIFFHGSNIFIYYIYNRTFALTLKNGFIHYFTCISTSSSSRAYRLNH